MSYGGVGPQGSPLFGVDYYNYLQGVWKDGTPLAYGGSGYPLAGVFVPAKYMYPGNSDPWTWGTQGVVTNPVNWSEINQGNVPSDRKGIGSMGGFTLQPGAVNRIDIALVSAIDYTGSGNQAPIAIMNERIDSVRSYFCQGLISEYTTGGVFTSLEMNEDEIDNIVIAPIPFTKSVKINYKSDNNHSKLLIYNLIGEEIMSQDIRQETTILNLSNQPNGIYFVSIIDGSKRLTKKIVKQ